MDKSKIKKEDRKFFPVFERWEMRGAAINFRDGFEQEIISESGKLIATVKGRTADICLLNAEEIVNNHNNQLSK
jgi:hypothetical protein